jgi:hypothetical protein
MAERESLETELRDLDLRRECVERRLREALDRQRFAADAAAAEAAKADERTTLRELDRLMTRSRAVEGQLLQLLGDG